VRGGIGKTQIMPGEKKRVKGILTIRGEPKVGQGVGGTRAKLRARTQKEKDTEVNWRRGNSSCSGPEGAGR